MNVNYLTGPKKEKNEVINQSTTELGKFLEGYELKDTVISLWTAVIKAFQEGGEVGGIRFDKNELPAHSEYHIAKMLTLAIELFEKLPQYENPENRLAISLAAILHDLGQLRQSDNDSHDPPLPQQAFSQTHEERGITLAQQILNYILPSNIPGVDRERLLRKVKVLIYGTQVSKDMNDDKNNPASTWEETAIFKEINSGSIVLNGEMIEIDDKEEYLALMRIFAAADHGSYLLEPARLAEILGLWQEKMRLWRDNGEISPSKKPNPQYFPLFLLSDFPQRQKSIYGGLLKQLGFNPFFKDESIDDFLKAQQAIFEQAKTVPFDPLVRFEGFFNPHQLLEFCKDIENAQVRSEIEDDIVGFSINFQSFHPPEDFSGLATAILVKIYQNLPSDKRPEFIKKAITEIVNESKTALTGNGKINLHIAPYAYGEELETFIGRLAAAVQDFPEIERVYLTYRQDQGDNLSAMIAAINSPAAKDKLGLAIGGKPANLTEVFNTIGAANVRVLIHFGLEENENLMRERIMELLQFLKTHSGQQQNISLHLDGHFDWFLKIYNELNDEQREKIQVIFKSASPLYLLLSQATEVGYQTAFGQLEQFIDAFSEIQPATNNACLLGNLGVIGHHLALMAAKHWFSLNYPSKRGNQKIL